MLWLRFLNFWTFPLACLFAVVACGTVEERNGDGLRTHRERAAHGADSEPTVFEQAERAKANGQEDFYCTGTPKPCTATPLSYCTSQKGCQLDDYCVQEKCSKDMGRFACLNAHCLVEETCDGESLACELLGTESSCIHQHGCIWFENKKLSKCTGLPQGCQDLAAAVCPQQIGCQMHINCSSHPMGNICSTIESKDICGRMQICAWRDSASCSGNPAPCEDQADRAACNNQRGCQWVAP